MINGRINTMYRLWNEKNSFPSFEGLSKIDGIKHIAVHTAIDGDYQFLLGAAIIKHDGRFRISFANSYRFENDDNTILAEKCSDDGALSWSDYKRISDKTAGWGRSHGVYFEDGCALYAFCPKARYGHGPGYPDLVMEGYVLDDSGSFKSLGIVLDADFWPLCEPIRLDNGAIVMAGLKTNDAQAAVALCDEKDLTKWEMKVIPNPQNLAIWGETTVLKNGNELIAIIRGSDEIGCALISRSIDFGKSWSALEKTNFPIAPSKMYAGTLSNGIDYLVFSSKKENNRDTLCIAIGKNGIFDKVFLIRYGFDAPPKYWLYNEWCYPYAYEDGGSLYVVYAKNKEDCELAILPINSLCEGISL